ncbi:Ig heavy chain V-III region CAM [Amazona aestiva]|uniref:Ig heavy chain V-III region CAM n=1 Tax=Amazona aestiva TaxID=12930 RepID=A0A0Q3M9I6_AMAAE|nr:Ig heavy chain V-III region CAM [Amazona aestiva]
MVAALGPWLLASAVALGLAVAKFVQSVESRASASRDNSRSESSLFLRALQPQDSARYFCVIYTETGKAAEL